MLPDIVKLIKSYLALCKLCRTTCVLEDIQIVHNNYVCRPCILQCGLFLINQRFWIKKQD